MNKLIARIDTFVDDATKDKLTVFVVALVVPSCLYLLSCWLYICTRPAKETKEMRPEKIVEVGRSVEPDGPGQIGYRYAESIPTSEYVTGNMSLGFFGSHAEYSVMINGCGGMNRMLASHSILLGGRDLTITNEWDLVIGGCDSNYTFRVRMETNEFWVLYNLLSRLQR